MPTEHCVRCRAAITAGSLVATAALAARGGSGASAVGATNATGDSSPIGLSRCMRSNGVTNFPDPTSGSGGEGFNGIGMPVGSGSSTLIVDGRTFSGPVVARAEQACRRYLAPSGPPPQLTSAAKRAVLAFAQCMRTHGVPGFPDPTFPAGGGVEINPGAGMTPQSPAFRAAMGKCKGLRIAVSGVKQRG